MVGQLHPREEDLKVLRKQLADHSGLHGKVHLQADPSIVFKLSDIQIAPSLIPDQRTPLVIGYLDNSKYEFLVGQLVVATIMVKPSEETEVEIPTDAVNPLNAQDFVFVENPSAKNQFIIRRVSVARSLKNIAFVRSKLTPEQERINLKLKEGEYRIQPLKPGERVVTRGVVELTAALEELRAANKKQTD
jgi:multidrug efflux pump subunit AcrA (membrane-fusion protein)